MGASFWLSVQELTKRRLGAVTAVAIIALAVAFTVGLELVSRSREAAVAADLDQIGPAIRIIPQGKSARDLARFELDSAPFTAEEIAQLRRECGALVSTIDRRLSLKVALRDRHVPVIGVAQETVVAPFDDYRRMGASDVVVGSELASELNVNQGQTIHIKGRPLRVLAVMPQTATEDDIALFMPLENLQRLVGLDDSFNEIRIYPAAGTDVQRLAASIAAGHPDTTVLTTQRGDTAEQSMQATLRAHRQALYLVTGVVIALSVLIWSYINGSERQRELATLVAIGGSMWTVATMIVLRGTLLGALGAVVGFLAGTVISLAQNFESTVRILPSFDVATIVILLAMILSIAGALPAAALLAIRDPVQILQDV